jgi:heat shock protein HslJ
MPLADMILAPALLFPLAAFSAASPPAPTLEGTRWKLVHVGDRSVKTPPSPRQAHLIFDAESQRVTGAGGCNRLSGGYERTGGQLTFSKMAGTMMACADGMETEKAFLEALTKVKSFRITGQGLDLLDGDGNVLATFEASPAPAAEA